MAPLSGVAQPHTIAWITLAGVYGFFLLVSTIVFFVEGRRDIHLSKRSLWLTSLGGIANVIVSTLFLLAFGFYNSYPCFLDFLADYLGVIPLCLTITGRAIRLVFISKLQISFAHGCPQSPTTELPGFNLPSSTLSTKSTRSTRSNKSFFSRYLLPSSQAVLERRLVISLSSILILDLAYTLITLFVTRSEIPDSSGKIQPTIAIFPEFSYSCTGAPQLLPFYVVMVLYFIVCPVVLLYGRGLRDAYGIRNSILYSFCIGMPCFCMYLVWAYLFETKYGMYFSSILWPMPAFFAIHWTSVIVPLWNYRRERLLVRIPPDSKEFEKVLSTPVTFAQFCRHSIDHFVAEHTRFLEDYQILKVKTIESFINQTSSLQVDKRIENSPLPPAHLPHFPHRQHPENQTVAPLFSSARRANHLYPPRSHAVDIYKVPPPTVGMLQSALPYLPPGSPTKKVPVPENLKLHYRRFYTTFIRPGGILETNLTGAVARRAGLAVEGDQMHIDMFEDAKREVLDLLFFNTFPGFLEQLDRESRKPPATVQTPRISGQENRSGTTSRNGTVAMSAENLIVLQYI